MSKKTDLDGYDAKTRRMMKGMAAAENRALAARAEEECECKEGMFPSIGRRGFLAAAGAAGAAALVTRGANAAAPPGAMDYPVQKDPTSEQGRLTSADGGYGSRSQFESEVRWRFPTAWFRRLVRPWPTGGRIPEIIAQTGGTSTYLPSTRRTPRTTTTRYR